MQRFMFLFQNTDQFYLFKVLFLKLMKMNNPVISISMSTEMAWDSYKISFLIKDKFLGIRWKAMSWIQCREFTQDSHTSLQNWAESFLLQINAKTLCMQHLSKNIYFIKPYTLNMHGKSWNLCDVSKVLKHIIFL